MTASAGHLGDLLSGIVDGALSPGERHGAEAHLAGCLACTAELEATRRIRALVRGLPAVEPARPLVPTATAPGRRWAAPAAAAAAAVAMALLATVGGQAPTPAPVGRLVQAHATSVVNTDPVSQLAPAAIPISFSSDDTGP